jgi:hypothetical protein
MLTKIVLAAALATALGVLGAASAVAGRDDMNERGERGGHVVPGSLDGVNPAYHPEIFGSAATAAAYGFVRSRDGAWHVRTDWRDDATKSRAEYHR